MRGLAELGVSDTDLELMIELETKSLRDTRDILAQVLTSSCLISVKRLLD